MSPQSPPITRPEGREGGQSALVILVSLFSSSTKAAVQDKSQPYLARAWVADCCLLEKYRMTNIDRNNGLHPGAPQNGVRMELPEEEQSYLVCDTYPTFKELILSGGCVCIFCVRIFSSSASSVRNPPGALTEIRSGDTCIPLGAGQLFRPD